jgi:competence protein ComEC
MTLADNAPTAVGDGDARHITRYLNPPSPRALWAHFREETRAQIDLWPLWLPVATGCGSAIYFILPREPTAWLAWILLSLAIALVACRQRLVSGRWMLAGLVLVAAAVGGFSAAKLRTERVRAPVAPADLGVVVVDAFVVDIPSPGQGGQRLLLAPIAISRLSPEETPIRVRVTLKPSASLPAPGQVIRLKAMINPPPPPASPGAYDFARDAFFDSIGGVGFALGAPEVMASKAPSPMRLALQMRINAMRWALTRQIVDILGPQEGGLAAAMVTGHEAFIPKAGVDNLRAAGLAHIISISGLHMAIVGGFTFAAIRLAIAAWPWLALRVSGKKVAALAGFAMVMGYLCLSGWPNPAIRAAVTASCAFWAMIFDRRAVSLHTLGMSALLILAVQPEAVTEPGFQMSFAATCALVAVAENWPRPTREIQAPWAIRLVQGAGTLFMASLMASLVAGLATGPFALQHFNRISTYGLASNLLVEPISTFVMLPALAIGAVLAPFGLGAAPLHVAGDAIAAMNRIAEVAATAPLSQITVASAPSWTLAASFLGILFLCIWRGRWRWLGLPLALAVSLVPRPPQPDAWVSADASAFAVRLGGEAIFFRPDVKLFAAQV